MRRRGPHCDKKRINQEPGLGRKKQKQTNRQTKITKHQTAQIAFHSPAEKKKKERGRKRERKVSATVEKGIF